MKKTHFIVSIICIFLVFAIAAAVAIHHAFKISEAPARNIENALDPALDYLIIVNGDNPYEFGSDYDTHLKSDLVYMPDVYGSATPLEKATWVAFLELQKTLNDKGMMIGLYSGYRTEADQQYVYDSYANREGWSETNKVAKPGYSEHHTGLLLNVLIWYQGEEDEKPIWYTETAERQETIPYFKLLHETLADYGFIDRYPSGKEDITGVPCEPYEIRFVGNSEIAHAIMDNGLTLEEWTSK